MYPEIDPRDFINENMADRRRRRRGDVTSESEYSEADTSKASIDAVKNSECESEGDDVQGEGSEYESATEENEEDDYTYTEDYSEDESSVLVEEEYTESDLFEEERQSGDGEEQPSSNQELDDDEDRKNPAFVPRKGMFYEHDDRQGEEEVETEVPPNEEKENIRKKKQLWQEVQRWDHDRFDERLQAPKSREELVAAYGYDIQAHDKPPEAPPSRGRGGRNRGRPSENRASFGDYMSGRFDNPRKPRYGPKAEPWGRGRGGQGSGRGGRRSRGGRGRADSREYRSYQDEREEGQGDRKSYSDFKPINLPRNNNNSEDYDRGNYNRYDNNMPRQTGQGDGYHGNRDRDYNNRAPTKSDTRTFTNSRVVQGNQQDYSNKSRNSMEKPHERGNRTNRSGVERQEPERKYSDYLDRQYSSQQDRGYRNRDGGNNRHDGHSSSGYHRNDRRDRGNRKSRSPEGKRPANPRAEASLDNLMDIAPPLTTIETRTKGNVHTSVADSEGRRGGGYGQDRRPKGVRRSQDDGQSDGQSKTREVQEKPPRFRDQGKDHSRSVYHGQPPTSSSQQQKQQEKSQYHQSSQPSAVPASSKPQIPAATGEQGKTVQVSITAATGVNDGQPPKPDVRQTKRYSSQRQRNIADSDNPTPPPPPLSSLSQQQQAVGVGVQGVGPQKPVLAVGPRAKAPTQVGVLPSGQIVQMPTGVAGKPEGPRVVSPPVVGTSATSPVRPRMSPQFFIQQQQQQSPQQQVFRQPPPVYRSLPTAPVTSAKSPPLSATQQAQLQQHLMQQQAIVMQVPSTQIQGGRIYATSQPVARPAPAAAITMATAARPRQQVLTQRTQFIPAGAAGPLVNLAATVTQPSGHFPITRGQVPVQFPVPPPQRAEVPATSANVANVVQAQIVTLPPAPPQGQLPATAVAIPTGQHPPLPQNQVQGQVVGPPGPGQPPAIHVRGGTTYFDPQIQLFSDGRSPARRQKEPIPIVKPQLPAGVQLEGEDGQFYDANEGILYQEQYAAYIEAQMYNLQATGQPVTIGQQPTLEEGKSSSFENILKQSGSLDNIKEFHPQTVGESFETVATETELIGNEVVEKDIEEHVDNGSDSNEDENDEVRNNSCHGDSDFVSGVDKDLQQLHISGASSIEHERCGEADDALLHSSECYSTERNESYSRLVEEDIEQGDMEEGDASIEREQIGGYSTDHLVNYNTLDGVNELRYTTEESDSDQFYEVENDIDPNQVPEDITDGTLGELESNSKLNKIQETVAMENVSENEPIEQETDLNADVLTKDSLEQASVEFAMETNKNAKNEESLRESVEVVSDGCDTTGTFDVNSTEILADETEGLSEKSLNEIETVSQKLTDKSMGEILKSESAVNQGTSEEHNEEVTVQASEGSVVVENVQANTFDTGDRSETSKIESLSSELDVS